MTNIDRTALASTLLSLRKAHGLTQMDVAANLDVTSGAVGQWETARTLPSLDALAGLADLYGQSVDRLLGRQGQHSDMLSGPDVSPKPDSHEVLTARRLMGALSPAQMKALVVLLEGLAGADAHGIQGGGQSELNADQLAQVLRQVDGKHDLGAAALADALLAQVRVLPR